MSKKLKIAICLTLVMVSVLSLFACKKQEQVEDIKKIYANQYENKIFYYSVGYPDDWSISYGDAGHELRVLDTSGNAAGYLCAKLFNSAKADEANVYVYKYDTTQMMNTLEKVAKKLMNDKGEYYFNDIFVENSGESRDSFDFVGEAELVTPNHNIQYYTVDYTFVKDGDDWKGTYYVTTCNSTWFLLLCEEARADVYDSYTETFTNIVKDLALVGFEGSN